MEILLVLDSMNSLHFIHIYILLISSLLVTNSHPYPSYQDCSPVNCGNSIIKFPFQIDVSPQCYGDYRNIASVSCHNNDTTLFCGSYEDSYFCPPEICLKVLGGITQLSYNTRTIRIAPQWLFNCSISIDKLQYGEYFDLNDFLSPFNLSDKYTVGTVLTCEKQIPFTYKRVRCLGCEEENKLCFFVNGRMRVSYVDGTCNSTYVVVPADKNFNISAERNLRQFLQRGFEVTWNYNISKPCKSCEASGGLCYFGPDEMDDEMDACICRNNVHKYNCSDGEPKNVKNKGTTVLKTVAKLVFGISIMALMFSVIIYRLINERTKRLREEEDMRAYMDSTDPRPASMENFLHGGMPTRYSYAQIKKYTNNFAERLGKGGFGAVYKGKLPTGCLLAVKIIEKSKHSQKQFMNEVATVGTIHHIHLVRLLGFCLEGSKRALVYEYMANGSLEKYIHEEGDGDLRDGKHTMDWKQLYSIAMGTARGIAYLHEECRSRIIHCDIKPHNILLDANFSPKVADFGLAKLADRDESHVSLTAARGTPGYVAPEVWSRNVGPVSDRSDVYSYGMLVMEMVGKRKNLDLQASKSSQVYYPKWAYKQVEMGEFGRLREGNIMDEEDENIVKKLSVVGLWCIQYKPCDRPPMSKVIQLLEGNIESCCVPPFPFPVNTVTQSDPTSSSSSI
uniref:Protein kinase domain-containing protein n=1 Tax=Araucaria cunninghamii TaxID=56994 RepID=A0A0D6QR68_ARACU